MAKNEHGAARFADTAECAGAGLFAPDGLYLGTMDGFPLFHSGKAHLLTVAPARTGKGVNVVLPNLLHYQGSVFVTDPKGELAAVTAKHRADTLGQKVYFLNPWNLHGLPNHCYNPIAHLVALAANKSRRVELFDEADAIANQLIPEPPDGGENFFFRAGGRNLLVAVMVFLASRVKSENCTLTEVRRSIQNPVVLDKMFAGMAAETKFLGGELADMGELYVSMRLNNPKELGNFITNALQALSVFRASGQLGNSLSKSDFSLEDLKTKKCTVYVMIPTDRVQNFAPWLGLISRQAISSVARGERGEPVLFMLDEFANMGKLAGFEEALTALPGLGVRAWMFVQDAASLNRIYGDNTAQVIRSQAEVEQYFTIENDELTKALSEALGNRTIWQESYNLGKDDDDEIGQSLSSSGVPLIRPDELRGLPAETQLLRIRGMNPIKASLTPYWLAQPWSDWAADNPVEGSHPRNKRPVFSLQYTER